MISVIAKLAKAREDFTGITKDARGYDYMYADLDGIVKAIEPGLIKQSLHFWHTFEQIAIGNTPYLNITCHVGDGESELTTTIPLSLSGVEKGRSPAQEMGKILTYGRRYSLTALLGLTADQDTDGQASQQEAQKQSSQGSRSQNSAPKPAAPAPIKGYAEGKEKPVDPSLFVDAPAAWTWLEGIMTANNLSDDHKSEIKKMAVGKPSKDVQAEVILRRRTDDPKGTKA